MYLPLTLLAANYLIQKPYSQESLDQYNILRFLSTTSPYISNPGYGISPEVPNDCEIVQVNAIARHGERYPTNDKGNKFIRSFERIQNLDSNLISGDLKFLPNYEFSALDVDYFEQLSHLGPYSGRNEMYQFGLKFQKQYSDLINDETFIFAASQERVVDSAIEFSKGLFNQEKNVIIIDEYNTTAGANTLTPGKSCLNYDPKIHKHLIKDYKNYLNHITKRLNNVSPELNISNSEVSQLLNYCGYDLNVSGNNKICKIFTTNEFLIHSYYYDLKYYYSKGPGHNMTKYIGDSYVSTLMNLFKNHQDIKSSVSFTHDTDLLHIFSTLGIFNDFNSKDEIENLPINYINFKSNWKISNITPMGGRLVFEKLKCRVNNDHEDYFVRILVNDAVIPIHKHTNGPGYSVSLIEFEQYIKNNLNYKSYSDICLNNDKNVPNQSTFLFDWR